MNSSLYQSRLVPRWISIFGLIGGALVFTQGLMDVFGISLELLAMPIALQEMVFAVWLIAKGFALMRSFQSIGTMRIYDAMGEEGTVYLTIPADGIGKIQVTISGRLMVMDAVSQDKVELKTGERVCVSEITSGGMLAVRGL